MRHSAIPQVIGQYSLAKDWAMSARTCSGVCSLPVDFWTSTRITDTPRTSPLSVDTHSYEPTLLAASNCSGQEYSQNQHQRFFDSLENSEFFSSLLGTLQEVTAGYSDAYRATGSRPRSLILDSGGRDSLQKMRFEVVRILRRKEFDRTCE